MMALAGFLVAVIVVDVLLTRDGIRRGGGKIREGNRIMVWLMATDPRAALVTVAEGAAVLVLYGFIEEAGKWWVGAAFFVAGVFWRGRVVLGNYRTNTEIL